MPPASRIPRKAIRMLVEADQLLEAANTQSEPLSELESLQKLDPKTVALRASNAIKRTRKAQKLIDQVKLESLVQAQKYVEWTEVIAALGVLNPADREKVMSLLQESKDEEDGGRDG